MSAAEDLRDFEPNSRQQAVIDAVAAVVNLIIGRPGRGSGTSTLRGFIAQRVIDDDAHPERPRYEVRPVAHD